MRIAAILLVTCAAVAHSAQVQTPKVPSALKDAIDLPAAGSVQVNGWLGQRILANATNRLLTVDTEPLLAGFHKKPGSHPWIGEHVGKWMHAATLAWAYTGDARLKEKLDRVAAELISTQEPDGYLGTYVPGKRFGLFQGSDWDVWSHKYNLIGLLTYYEYTGNESALNACRKMGDLLIATFGPGKKSIISAGTHVGMAATSVLEPMVVLHRFTGEKKYLDFCKYIVKSWDEEGGPRIVAALLTEKQVNKTANAKAYEMLSNLVGLCELARTTGSRELLTPVLNAWQDIVKNRLYITGSASQAEHFGADHHLPNATGAHVAETCVTTTWIQFNMQLLRLTGDARFANELEKTFYNHLSAAQHPRGDDWCYFTSLEGKKPYTSGINCCHSSGPRGMALAGLHGYLVSGAEAKECLFVNNFETSSGTVTLGGKKVQIQQTSAFPTGGSSQLRFKVEQPTKFALAVRVPPWSPKLSLRLNGESVSGTVQDGWLKVPAREWKAEDVVDVRFEFAPEMVEGLHGNAGLRALRYGPFIMAYDTRANPGMPLPALLAFDKSASLGKPDERLNIRTALRSPRLQEPKQAVFKPFADAGAEGGTYRIWLPGPETSIKASASLLVGGEEARSRGGNLEGSIIDGDPSSIVVTFNNRKADEDWYAVTMDEPVSIRRVVFTHGQTFHDGGWFDASKGKPRVQVQTQKGGSWKTIGELDDYPATTGTNNGGLKKEGQSRFTLSLPSPISALAVRVVGVPAAGDNPEQAFSSCGELEAFAE